MSAVPTISNTVRAVVKGSKSWTHKSPVLTVRRCGSFGDGFDKARIIGSV